MAFEFKNILSALGLNSSTDPVTEANLQAADDKIALLEQEKAAAETKVTQAEAAQAAAVTALDTAKTNLQAEQDKVKTLEDWKQKQKATDGREEDDSNNLDDDADQGPKASWEVAAGSAIASVKKRLGEK
jgi:hypothetical protein